jgi:hypothetical protein
MTFHVTDPEMCRVARAEGEVTASTLGASALPAGSLSSVLRDLA